MEPGRALGPMRSASASQELGVCEDAAQQETLAAPFSSVPLHFAVHWSSFLMGGVANASFMQLGKFWRAVDGSGREVSHHN